MKTVFIKILPVAGTSFSSINRRKLSCHYDKKILDCASRALCDLCRAVQKVVFPGTFLLFLSFINYHSLFGPATFHFTFID